MNAITRRPPVIDPQHLHLAAIAMAYPVRLGALSYSEAASALALAAIQDGALARMNDREFLALRSRLEHSLIKATIEIDRRSADVIREVIRRPIVDRRPKQMILLIAQTTNQLFGTDFPNQKPEHAFLPRMTEEAVVEICKQEFRKATEAARSAHGR